MERDRTGGFDESRLSERVEFLGPEISLDALRSAITTRIIDRLGSNWDEMYGPLLVYREREGHCRVPTNFVTVDGHQLGAWVNNQRRNRHISADRRALLDEIGFVWGPHEADWREGYDHLIAYKQREGLCAVPKDFVTDDGHRLGGRVNAQRSNYDAIPTERRKMLDEIGFVWRTRRSPRRLCALGSKSQP